MPRVDTDDLIDAHAVAEILGLAHANSVSTYQRRYQDMPRPVVDLGRGRPRLWLRPEIVRWARGWREMSGHQAKLKNARTQVDGM